jgi:outer membrane immunogenic protein
MKLSPRNALLALVAFAAMTTAPIAAVAENAPAASMNWAGPYIGIQLGYQWNDADFRDPIPPLSGSYDADGIIAGGHVGYNIQHGAVVFGIQGEFEFADGSGTGPTQAFDVFGRGAINWQGSVLGRLGYSSGQTLIYVTGGVTFADFDFNYTCCNAGYIDPLSKTLTGLTIGAGFEIDLGNNWSTQIEARYTDFERAKGSIVNCCAALPFHQEHDIEARSFRFALNRRF